MKIDLRKDRGVLDLALFSTSGQLAQATEAASDDELIIETLKRRHEGSSPEKTDADKVQGKQAKKERNAIPILLMILILTVAGAGYMLNSIGLLMPGINLIESYWRGVLGLPVVHQTELIDDADYYYPPDLTEESVMSDDQFNELMPMTEDLAALADSLAALPDDSVVAYTYPDTEKTDAVEERRDSIIIQVQNLPPLSDDDIIILNNRSLMLLVMDILQSYPSDMTDGHLYMKRDALRLSAPTGGEWVDSLQAVMDKFVLGSYKADYSTGKVQITSKFSLIMAREADFQANVLDGLRMLDVLANPFNDYLQEIVIDLSRDVDNNPATFTFSGSPREMQYILSAWSESRTNLLLRSIDIKFKGDNTTLTFDVILFDYRS